MLLTPYIEKHKIILENAICQYLPNSISPILYEACLYAISNGGKRLRGLMPLITYQGLNSGIEIGPNIYNNLIKLGVSLEYIHAFSLVHDDMPCMDNDILRRGMPTIHIKYNEAMALLVGDTLMIEGIRLANSFGDLDINELILQSIGSNGMCAGQSLDMEAVIDSLDQLIIMHKAKTGALIQSSILAGAYMYKANKEEIKALSLYAMNIGLAFQIIDDILDITSTADILGKSIQKDQNQNKITFLSFMNIDQAREYASDLIIQAKDQLRNINISKNSLLDQLADYIIERSK